MKKRTKITIFLCLFAVHLYGMQSETSSTSCCDISLIHEGVRKINMGCALLMGIRTQLNGWIQTSSQMMKHGIKEVQQGINLINADMKTYLATTIYNAHLIGSVQAHLASINDDLEQAKKCVLNSTSTEINSIAYVLQPSPIAYIKTAIQKKEELFATLCLLEQEKPEEKPSLLRLAKEASQGLMHIAEKWEESSEQMPENQDSFNFGNLLSAATKTGRSVWHYIQAEGNSPEEITEALSEEQDHFNLKNLLVAAIKTGFPSWRHIQVERGVNTSLPTLIAQEKTNETNIADTQDEPEKSSTMFDLTLDNATKKLTTLAQKANEQQPALSAYLQDENHQDLIRDGAEFIINPDNPTAVWLLQQTASYGGLSLARSAASFFKHPKAKSLEKPELAKVLNRKGIKPATLAQLSHQIGEELKITAEQREHFQKKVSTMLVPDNFEKVVQVSSKITNLLAKTTSCIQKINKHHQTMESDEKKLVKFLKKLGKQDQIWHEQQLAKRG